MNKKIYLKYFQLSFINIYKIIYLISIFVIISGCEETIDTFDDSNNCNASIEGIEFYKTYAEWLTIYQVEFDDNSKYIFYRDSINIPFELMESINYRLANIYDLEDLPERDTIIEKIAPQEYFLFF